ncbi:hypothetical protein HOG17_02335 [Candidatus Peregrinibacteria bacterium]|jgi:hypothetical protein|nr:hypothetical protein [Candidatus Peregrinibacteria bacterium]MBT4056443.1 hypothetical protein [Candidatus Peregrinibacteria bacterium]MBT4456375.1 hypothetical protein [Candidatus Peregrinibacteria bacterium]
MSTANICKTCSAPFQITSKDEEFYKHLKVPHPTLCPACSSQRRLAYRNENCLHKNTCHLCKKPMISVFHKNTPYTVYCNNCWWSDKWDPMDYGKKPDFSNPFFNQFYKLQKSIPHFTLFQDGTSENCEYTNFGLFNKNCYMSMCGYSEDIYYSSVIIKSKSCMDCKRAFSCELCYECIECDTCYNLDFGKDCANCVDSQFLEDCIGCNHCFCCAGLRHKKYCFQNKQLTRQEYEKRLAKTKPLDTKHWQTQLTNLAQSVPKNYMHGNTNENSTGNYLNNTKNCTECFDCGHMEDSAYCDTCGLQVKDAYRSTNCGVGSELCYEVNGVTAHHNCIAIYFARSLSDCQYCQYCFNSKDLFGCIGLNQKRYCIFNRQYTKEEYHQTRKRLITHMLETGEYGEFFPIKNSPYPYKDTVAMDYFSKQT